MQIKHQLCINRTFFKRRVKTFDGTENGEVSFTTAYKNIIIIQKFLIKRVTKMSKSFQGISLSKGQTSQPTLKSIVREPGKV